MIQPDVASLGPASQSGSVERLPSVSIHVTFLLLSLAILIFLSFKNLAKEKKIPV